MDGILFLVDDKNRKKFVQIDLEKYGGEYLQDLLEGLVAYSRKDEESVSFEDVLKELKF